MTGFWAIIIFIFSCVSVREGLGAEEIKATPNRPGVANTADVTQEGVLELEYGWERGFRSSDIKTRTAASGLFRFGLTENFELRLGMNNYLSQLSPDHGGRRSGIGDTSPGFKYQLFEETGIWPTFSFSYEVKVPTASRKKGLGSGRVDHELRLLIGKEDLLGLDWDFNYVLGWIGKEGKKSFDDSHLLALSASRPLFGPLGIQGEIYGSPRVNQKTPGIISTDWALIYTVTPRVILDAGVDIGLNSAARDITYFAGITIALVDLYKHLGLKD